MFNEGDRVMLNADFNNEPGVIVAGTTGIVTAIHEGRIIEDLIYVRFDNVDGLEEHSRHSNAEIGLPMYVNEIFKV